MKSFVLLLLLPALCLCCFDSALAQTVFYPTPLARMSESPLLAADLDTEDFLADCVPASNVEDASEVASEPADSGFYSREELEAIVQAAYAKDANRYRSAEASYTRYATVSPRSAVWQHLMDSNHQFTREQVSGMSQNVALGLHGLHHAGKITPYRNSGNTLVVTKKVTAPQKKSAVGVADTGCADGSCPLVSRSESKVQSGCANGQCARPATTYRARSGGLFRRIFRSR